MEKQIREDRRRGREKAGCLLKAKQKLHKKIEHEEEQANPVKEEKEGKFCS